MATCHRVAAATRSWKGWASVCDKTHHELDELDGPLRPGLEVSVGKEFLDHEVEVWHALCAVLDTAELGAGHWRAIRP